MRILRCSACSYLWRPRSLQNPRPSSISYSSSAAASNEAPKTSPSSPIEEEEAAEFLSESRSDAGNARRYFEWAQSHRGDSALDSFCVLLHILVRSGRLSSARELVRGYLLDDFGLRPSVIINRLIKTSERCHFPDSRSLDYLLMCYVYLGRIQNAVEGCDWMVNKGVFPGVRARHCLLSAFPEKNHIRRALNLFQGTKDKGTEEDVRMELHRRSFTILMKASLKQHRYDEVEALLSEMSGRGLKPNDVAYYTLIRALCEKPKEERLFKLLRETRAIELVHVGQAYFALITSFVNRGRLRDAFAVKADMIKRGKRLALEAGIDMMKAYLDQGDLKCALALLATIVDQGIAPDDVMYCVLIKGCCRLGDEEKACEIYHRMRRSALVPNSFAVNLLINSLLKINKHKQAFALFEDAVGLGATDAFTYNIIIHWLCKEGRLKEARDLWAKMADGSVKPNIYSYNNMIFGYCKEGDMVSAYNFFEQLLHNGIQPNVFTYTILVDGFMQKKDLGRACDLLDEMQQKGVYCNDYTFNTFINGLCKAGHMSDANEVLNKFKQQGFTPSCMTYNSVLHGFMKEGNMTLALSVLRDMREIGILPNVVTYTSLIDYYCKSNCVDLAWKLWNEMRRRHIQADTAAYTALILGLCKEGKMDAAVGLLDEMSEAGLMPNSIIYNSIISGYKELNNVEAAFELHRRMRKERVHCDTATYTTLIDAALKVGNLVFASELYSEMLENGIVPDAKTYGALTNGLCNSGNLENARKILEEMDKRNVRPNVLIYNTLIAGCFREGNMKEAYRLHDEMLDRGLVPDDRTYDILVSMEYGSETAYAGT